MIKKTHEAFPLRTTGLAASLKCQDTGSIPHPARQVQGFGVAAASSGIWSLAWELYMPRGSQKFKKKKKIEDTSIPIPVCAMWPRNPRNSSSRSFSQGMSTNVLLDIYRFWNGSKLCVGKVECTREKAWRDTNFKNYHGLLFDFSVFHIVSSMYYFENEKK